MKPMNELLADIVTASGGTVTSNTRNGLLGDWLDSVSSPSISPTITLNPASQSVDEYGNVTFTGAATGDEPITYQWYKNGSPVGTNSTSYTLTAAASDNGATVYFTATNASGSATSSSATLTVVSYTYRLDGTTQSFELAPTISLSSGDVLNVYVIRSSDVVTYKRWIFAGSGFRVNVQANNKFELIGCTAKLDGVQIANYGTEYPADGLEHFLEVTITSATTLDRIGVIVSGISERWIGSIRDFKQTRSGTVINAMPLNNKSQGATQLATVGSVNATIINYSAANWVIV